LTKRILYSLLLALFISLTSQSPLWAQEDITVRRADTTLRPVDSVIATAPDTVLPSKVDSTWFNHSPRKATIRSAIIPGWGQAYNKQYWKIPIVYGALGTTAAVFVYNIQNYRELRFAYAARYTAAQQPPAGAPPGWRADSTDFNKLKTKYQIYPIESIRYYRDEFRKNVDYSVLVFILFWGLNVADAAAAAHLRTFDVSPDLSLRIKPGRSYMGGTNGVSLILAFK
jgi:Family of unknown function (DUF5683)